MASLHLPVPGILNFDAENVATVFRDWKQHLHLHLQIMGISKATC